MQKTSLTLAIVAIVLALAGGGAAVWAILRPLRPAQPTTTTPTESAQAAVREPGTYTAFIDSIDLTNQEITFDQNTWLTGDEAKQADLESGGCDVLENCAPNDFYVDNPKVDLETVPATNSVLVWVLTMLDGIGLYQDDFGGVAAKKVSLEDLAAYIERPDRNAQLTYELTFDDQGRINEIRERYQP